MRISCFYDNVKEAARQTGKDIPAILDEVKAMGIDALECSLESLLENELETKVMFAEAGLEVSAVSAVLDFGTAPDASYGYELIDTAVSYGARKVLVIPGFVPVVGDPYEQSRMVGTPVMQQMAKNLNQLAQYARSRGVLMTIEDYDDVAAPFCSEVQLKWFTDNVPSMFVCFDAGNFMYADVSEQTAFDVLKDRIVHVHLKDRDVAGDDEEQPKIAINGNPLYAAPVGYGVVCMYEIVKSLKAIGYDDTLAIELYGAPDMMRYLKTSVQWIMETWNEEE